MENLNSELANTFDAISILLVFVTILFGIRFPEVKELLLKPIMIDKPKATERFMKEIYSTLFFKWFPVVLLVGGSTYLMSPLAFKIINNSSFSFFQFDFTRTVFVFVWVLLIIFTIQAIYISVKLVIKARKCSNNQNVT